MRARCRNSSRWLQWHWPAQDAAGRGALRHRHHGGDLPRACRRPIQKEGGAFPDPILNLNWPYAMAGAADAGRARAGDQRLHGGADRRTSTADQSIPAGQQLDGFAQLKDDGKTACGCWIYSGCYTEKGNTDGPPGQHRSRRPRHRAELGLGVAGQPARALQPRLLRPARASRGRRRRSSSSGTASSGSASTCRITAPTVAPDKGVGPFIMNQEGVARLWIRGLMRDGPFPTHYEPFESPVANLLAPKIKGNPASRIFKDDLADLGDREGLPLRGDQLPPDRALPLLDQARPDQRDPAAGVLRGDLGAARRGEGHRARAAGSASGASAAS